MTREKEVKLWDGTIVRIRALRQRETEKAWNLSGMGVNPETGKTEGDLLAFTRIKLSMAVVSPKELQSPEALADLEEQDYNTIRDAYTELSVMKKEDKAFLSEPSSRTTGQEKKKDGE